MPVNDVGAYERVQAARDFLLSRASGRAAPRVGIVLGSGLGSLTERLSAPLHVPYAEIPWMPVSTVVGHSGEVIFGELGGVPVVCLSGRAHLYEGHPPQDVVHGVRLLAELGVSCVILTNAAGGIAKECAPGTLLLLTDHLNLTGQNPLTGPNDARIGPRFSDMSVAYDEKLRALAHEVARSQGIVLNEGVYAGLLGPSYETPAEIRMLETLDASAVGMSTVLETIALRHRGVRVLGISCITNHAAGKSSSLLSHDDVGEVARQAGSHFSSLVTEVVTRIGNSLSAT